VATIFVDHYSDLDYVHVQESTSAEDTIEAKQTFENFCLERGVRVEHYYADNGIFASRGFREEVQRCGQKLTIFVELRTTKMAWLKDESKIWRTLHVRCLHMQPTVMPRSPHTFGHMPCAMLPILDEYCPATVTARVLKNSSHNHKYDQPRSTCIHSAAQFMSSKLLYKAVEHNQSGMTVLV
jgi:hypothetical protein